VAVWQYDVALVPRAGVIRLHGQIPDELPGFRAVWNPEEELERESPTYWAEGEGPEALADEIGASLHPCPSWSDHALMFGDEKGHKLELWKGESVIFRFDLRKPDMELLRAVVRFAQAHDLLWVSDTFGRPTLPELQPIIRDIQASDAYRFCSDPLAYFESLPKEAKISEPAAGGNAE
jgi:hypothetical protein